MILSFLSLVFVALWLGMSWGPGTGATDWQGLVMGHILEEEQSLRAPGEVSGSHLRRLFASLGGDLGGDLGQVRFAGRCVIGEQEGIHLVLAGEQGPVTALFMPGESLPTSRRIGTVGQWGLLVPTDFGNLAVVGAPGESLQRTARRLLSEIDWKSSGS